MICALRSYFLLWVGVGVKAWSVAFRYVSEIFLARAFHHPTLVIGVDNVRSRLTSFDDKEMFDIESLVWGCQKFDVDLFSREAFLFVLLELSLVYHKTLNYFLNCAL